MEDRNMENGFEKDPAKDTDLRGDGCHNCAHNPRYQTRRRRMGRPKVDPEVFEEEFKMLEAAYMVEVEQNSHDVYWEHLAYTFTSNQEFKDVMYMCIDEYYQFPTVAEILAMIMRVRFSN